MRSKVLLAIVALAALAAFYSLSLAASEPGEGSVIAAVKGDPKIMKKGSDTWTSCEIDMSVDTGDRIRTSTGEEAQVSFAEKSNFIKISEDSDVMLLIARGGGSIDLLNGEALALIKNLKKGSTFEIKTPTGVAGARGTGLGSRTNGSSSTFSSYERSIYVRGIDRSGSVMSDELIVEEGFGTTVDKFEKPERLERLSDNDMGKWNDWKDNLRDQSARDRDDSSRDKLDSISRSEDNEMDQLDSQKDDVTEVRDIQRIEERSEAKESTRESESQGGGSLGPI